MGSPYPKPACKEVGKERAETRPGLPGAAETYMLGEDG